MDSLKFLFTSEGKTPEATSF